MFLKIRYHEVNALLLEEVAGVDFVLKIFVSIVFKAASNQSYWYGFKNFIRKSSQMGFVFRIINDFEKSFILNAIEAELPNPNLLNEKYCLKLESECETYLTGWSLNDKVEGISYHQYFRHHECLIFCSNQMQRVNCPQRLLMRGTLLKCTSNYS